MLNSLFFNFASKLVLLNILVKQIVLSLDELLGFIAIGVLQPLVRIFHLDHNGIK